jgi:subtilisin family serine protease
MIPLIGGQHLVWFCWFQELGGRTAPELLDIEGDFMRFRFLAGTAALVLLCGVSVAQAAENVPGTFDSISLTVGSLFAPTMHDADGSVYGVRGKDLTAKPVAPTGVGNYEILEGSPSNKPTGLTPGACASAGFPGGWCNTAHGIAASAFGWDFHVGGAGVIIGIVDTGIDLNEPEFAGRVLTGTCIVSSVNPCTLPDDQVGGDDAVFPGAADSTHGTHVAGIAAGTNTGIAYLASILPVKVCGSNADSCIGVDNGILWASQHGASIISVSIGGPILAASDTAMFAQAVANGSLLVVAGGNSGNKDPSSGFLAGAALADGVRGSMIVVGATGCNGTSSSVPANCANGPTAFPSNGYGSVASFSQVPSTQCEVHEGQRYCMRDYFVSAPGVDIWSTVGNGTATGANYGYLSGTSMATPFVSGVAAVIKGQWPFLTSSQIASIIFQTTDDIGAAGVDPVYGRGAVDITKALGPAGATIVANHSFSIGAPIAGNSGPSVSSNLGVAGAMNSLVSGPLSVAISNSTILKSAVLIDSFGRNFTANLTNATYNPAPNLTNYFMSSAFTTFSPFGVSMDSPVGQLEASGYAVETTTPRLLSGEFRTSDYTQYDMRDVQLRAALAPGVSLDAGYHVDMAGRFNSYDAQSSAAYEGLFLSASAVNSPYAAFTTGGNYLATNVDLADNLHFRFGESSLTPTVQHFEVPVYSMLAQTEGPGLQYDQRTAQSTMAVMNWDFASWGGLGLTATQTSEQNGLLGGLASGAFSVANNANTSALGASARLGFGDGWVTTVSYSEGITQLDLKVNSLLSGADTLHSRSYGVAIAKKGLFGDDDSIGMAVSRPVQIYAGGVTITAADGIDANNNLTVASEHVSLASQTPETDFELGYVTTFFDGALALQANAGYQMNVAGQGGQDAMTVISRAKINF